MSARLEDAIASGLFAAGMVAILVIGWVLIRPVGAY